MVIETTLPKDLFIRLSLLRHFQRRTFYFNAITSVAIAMYGLLQNQLLLLYVAWVPFIGYILVGIISAFRETRSKDSPLFLPTRYEFTSRGVQISVGQNTDLLQWEHVSLWTTVIGCYVLTLSNGAIIAIPQSSVPPHQVAAFDALLSKHIGKR